MKKIGIIGYGTIGRFIHKQIMNEENIEVCFVYDPYIDTVEEISGIHVNEVNEELLKSVDLVVEVAVSEVVQKYYKMILKHTNFLIFSGTALADETCEKGIIETTKKNNTACYIPHGVVLGLDGIYDGNTLLESVEIVTTKKPKGFSVDCNERTLLYEGATRGACKAYPRNVNVHAAIDAGHFHPTEVISNKISALSLFMDEILLHVSRPVRWDSDHVVVLDDELMAIAQEIVRGNLQDRIHIGLDFFDASINRVAAWTIGTRNMFKALLIALLEPTEMIQSAELEFDFTKRLAMLEETKSLPWHAVWDYYCMNKGVPVGIDWMDEVKTYETNVLSKRN